MRAVIYARVSSAKQRDSHTIESQLQLLPAFVARQGWELVDTYVDDGFSAASGKLDKRLAMQRLMADAKKGLFDVVAVVDSDRLTRTESLRERGEILGTFQEANVSVAELNGGVHDLNSSSGDLLVGLKAFYNAEENRKRRERVIRGKARAIEAGRKPAGPTPYGLRYDRATGVFSIHDEEAEIIREIYRRVAAGESCREIELDFRQRCIASPGAGRKNSAGFWSKERVWRAATNGVYRGEWVVDKAAGRTIPVPAIVTEDEWQAAQDALKRKGKRGGGRAKYTYLLAGLARCAKCGARIGISTHGYNTLSGRKRAGYYVCSARRRPAFGQPKCSLSMRRVDEVDGRVWVALVAQFEERWDELADLVLDRKVAAQRDAEGWAGDLKQAEGKLKKLAADEAVAMRMFRKGSLSEAALDNELAEIARERAAWQRQRDGAQRAVAGTEQAQEGRQELLTALSTLRGRLAGLPMEKRRRIMQALTATSGEFPVLLGDFSVEVHLGLSIGAAQQASVGQPLASG